MSDAEKPTPISVIDLRELYLAGAKKAIDQVLAGDLAAGESAALLQAGAAAFGAATAIDFIDAKVLDIGREVPGARTRGK